MHQAGSGDDRRDCHGRVPLRPFRYAWEPLCLVALGAYAANRWVFHPTFLQGWFNDILLLPAALPIFLWMERKIGLRKTDVPPRGREIAFYFVAWSVAAEIIAPRFFSRSTADPLDVVWYAVGAVVCYVVWATSAPDNGCRAMKVRGPGSGL
ncbi:MAG: hypothetical protein ACOYNN_01225 [Terrimicrobiaceae bacterium]